MLETVLEGAKAVVLRRRSQRQNNGFRDGRQPVSLSRCEGRGAFPVF
jgi:hypothetical protein